MEHAYQQYFNALPCYLTVQDREFRIIDANDRFREDFGDWEGRYCYQVYKHRSEKCEVCPVEQVFHDGQSHRSEEQVVPGDGREVSVLVEATPIRGESGKIESVIEMSTDVTHIQRLSDQLKRSQDRLRLLFDEVPCYISIQNRDLNIVEANRLSQETFGSCLGRKCYEVYRKRTEECVPCAVNQTFEDGRTHSHEEVLTDLEGQSRHVLVTTTAIRSPDGEIDGVMEMAADITTLRELQSQLSSLGMLVGSISHGLKGLLNGLSGGMYLVNSGLKKEDRPRMLKGWEMVQRNVAQVKSMVSDILYYAKDRDVLREPLSPSGTARDACDLVQARADDLGVELVRDFAEDVPDFEADPQALRSLLVNLVENSIDACRLDKKKSEHRVTVELRGTEDAVLYSISDNGIGMDEETREKAFSLFFSSKGLSGTGLGLFIANKIVRAHSGMIDLTSEPGVGTQFNVILPRTPPDEAGAEPDTMTADPQAGT
jgi:PAS domain S-box-containing protein